MEGAGGRQDGDDHGPKCRRAEEDVEPCERERQAENNDVCAERVRDEIRFNDLFEGSAALSSPPKIRSWVSARADSMWTSVSPVTKRAADIAPAGAAGPGRTEPRTVTR